MYCAICLEKKHAVVSGIIDDWLMQEIGVWGTANIRYSKCMCYNIKQTAHIANAIT